MEFSNGVCVYILHEGDGFGIEDALKKKLVGYLKLLTFLLNVKTAQKENDKHDRENSFSVLQSRNSFNLMFLYS